jgi:hypothetical protein
MTIQNKLAPFIAAGVLMSSVAAHSQTVAAPDPNMAPSTVGEESTLPATAASKPQLSTDPDPDLAPSIAGEEAQLPGTPADSPQLATDPDPDLATSTDSQGTGGQ